jgi:hypothetical protein
LVIALVALVSFFVIPWILIFAGIYISPSPPSPDITYAEFPFRLEYEINGQRKVVQDVLICEFVGIGMNEGTGKYREWKKRLASGSNKIQLLVNYDKPGYVFNNMETITQIIFYDPGPAWYYMGDGDGYNHAFPDASFSEEYKDGGGAEGFIRADELEKLYNIKLISWEISEPITNYYK